MANIQTPVEVRHDGEEQAALQRLATIVAQGMPPAAIFSAVSREVEVLFEADAAAVVKFEHDPPAVILLGTGDNIRSSAIGVRSEFVDGYAATAVYKTGRSARVDAREGEVIDGPVFAYTRNVETGDSLRFTSAVASPLLVDGKLWGAISVSGSRSLPPDTEARLERFTAIVAPAIANADSREELATLAAEQAALRRVATLAAGGATPEEVFAAVAREVAELFGVPLISMGRFEADGTSIVIGNWGEENPFGVGARFDPHPGVGELIRQTGRPARIDAYTEVPGAAAAKLVASGVRSSIGAPIFVDGRTWGAVAVLSTAPDPLPRRAEDRLASFTELLSTAIASSDSREALAALADEQAALRRVATLVARDAPSADVFAAVATEVARLFDTEITVVGRYENGFAVAIGNWSASGGGVPAGTRSAIGGHNVLTLVAETGKPARIDGYDDASGEAADIARRYGWRSSIAAPIIVEDHLWGVMLVATERPEGFPPAAEHRLAAFTDLVATAIANTQSRAEVQQLADEQAALRRVATVVAKEDLPEAVFAKVAEETGRVLGGVECTLLRSNRDGSATNVGSWGEKVAAVFPHGSRFYPDGDGVASTVLRTGQPYRIDDYSAVADPVARGARERGTESAVGCPRGKTWLDPKTCTRVFVRIVASSGAGPRRST